MHRVLSPGGEEDEDKGEIASQVEKPFLGTDHGFREEDKIDNFSRNIKCIMLGMDDILVLYLD